MLWDIKHPLMACLEASNVCVVKFAQPTDFVCTSDHWVAGSNPPRGMFHH